MHAMERTASMPPATAGAAAQTAMLAEPAMTPATTWYTRRRREPDTYRTYA